MPNPTATPRAIACPACNAVTRADAGAEVKTLACTACGAPLFAGHPMKLTAEGFTAHTSESDLPLVIDFWADWCGPCKTMAPVFESLAAEFEPHVRFAKVDTDRERELAEYFRISTIPTLSFIAGRREVARVSGAMFAGDLRRWLYDALSRAEEGASPERAG